MAVHAPSRQTFARGQPQTMQVTVMPAPIAGMDGRLNLASNDPTNCVYAYNLVPSEYGMRTRQGFREWAIELEDTPGAGLGVRTIIPYTSVHDDHATDKLFAITNEGIWDATAFNTPPTLDLAFTDQTDAAGWGIFAHYTTDAAEVVLRLADSANGLFDYDPVLDTWAQTTGIQVSAQAPTGTPAFDITNVVFVVEHKQRLWLIEKDVTHAWYLPVGSTKGDVLPFYFGSKFKHGGDLVGLYNWTLDSGSGVDDKLVAVSRAGDVIPYEGADPSGAVGGGIWQDVGTFFIGDVPTGRRIGGEYGGDLHLLSTFGLTAMSDLLRSGLARASGASESVTQKIARFVRRDMDTLSQDQGWEIRFDPSEGILLIGTPQRANATYLQYRVNLSVDGWAFWRGVPMITSDTWQGAQMFGTLDNRVMRMDVGVDNQTFLDPKGSPVEFSMLTNYFDMQTPGLFKFGEFIRPNWLARTRPSYNAKFLYDFRNATIPAGLPGDVIAGGVWDISNWDQALWGSDEAVPFHTLEGSWGPGRTMAVAIRGDSISRSTLVSMDAMWRPGGPF